MAVETNVVQVAAAWLPQRPGRRRPRDIVDALVEPDWGGARVVAALSEDRAALFRDGQEVAVPAENLEALLDGFTALDAVVEGHLTMSAFQTGELEAPVPIRVERAPLLVPRISRRRVKDDPYVHARDVEAETAMREPIAIEAIERGEPHAFVAVDLLWLDGQALDGIPLLERKRLLEAVLGESHLVRISAFVRTSAVTTLVAWGTLGFGELSYRASNSRYLAGEVNPDWVMVPAPDSPVRQPLTVPPK